jgi:uncharacterized membrane protein (DUF441 family)
VSHSLIILIAIALLGIIGKNSSVAIAAGSLFIFRLLIGERSISNLEDFTLKAGITILTMAVLLPFAAGEFSISSIFHSLKSYPGFVSFLVGVTIAYLGGRGVVLLTSQPQILVGLLVGTIIGVAFFRGVPVGPLIGAGIVALILSKLS